MKTVSEIDLVIIGYILNIDHIPTTILYHDEYNKCIRIVEWYDITDEGDDLYFMYTTDKETLINYFKGDISHLEIIKTGTEFYQFKFNFEDIKAINLTDIPSDSLPNSDSMFDKNYTDKKDLNKIYNYLGYEK